MLNKNFMKKYSILAAIISFSIILAACSSQNTAGNPASASKAILFYGETCPHCVKVEKFIEDNKIAEKIQFDRLETFKNKDNSALMLEKASACGLDQGQIGVPFYWDSGKCVVGDSNIEEYLKTKMNAL
jgi:glutaredoxin